jgi:ABC-type uncharacterized transport system auxiliary subunit
MMTISQSRPAGASRSWFAAISLSLLACLFCSGCLSKPALKRQTFAFDNPPPANTASATGGIVALRSVTVSALFSKQPFVYRTGPQAYETDTYAGFMVTPSQTIAIAVRAHLLNSGRFQDVVEPDSQIKADKYVEVQVSELYGDFRKSGQSAAILSMRICAFGAGDAGVVLQKDYSRRIPLKENTAAAVMAGWNTALGEIMTEAAADLAGNK